MASDTRLVVSVLRLEISLSQRALGPQYLFGFTSLPLSSLCLIILYRPTFSEGRVMYMPARETLWRPETSVRPISPPDHWGHAQHFPWLWVKFRGGVTLTDIYDIHLINNRFLLLPQTEAASLFHVAPMRNPETEPHDAHLTPMSSSSPPQPQ